MGYTHYWRRPQQLDAATFCEFTNDCRKIIEAAENQGIRHGSGDGDNEPLIEPDVIAFNGHNQQPIGMWTTSEEVGLVWPSDQAGIETVNVDPIAEKIVGSWFAGTLAVQRTAPIDNSTGCGSGSYETFLISQSEKRLKFDTEPLIFNCTKTNYRPYDLTVTACLIAFKHHFKGLVKVSTDGEEKDWIDGRILVFNALGYGMVTDIFAEPTEVPPVPPKPKPWDGKPAKQLKDIAAEIKTEMRGKGVILSVKTNTQGTANSIDIYIMEGVAEISVKEFRYNINQFSYKTDDNLTDYGKKVTGEILEIINRYHWDASDSQSDYFHCAFYYSIEAGKWDKPYKVTPITPEIAAPDLVNHEGVQIIDYSDKALAVIGDTKPIKDRLKSIGGRFNFRLSCGPGWIFPKSKEMQLRQLLA